RSSTLSWRPARRGEGTQVSHARAASCRHAVQSRAAARCGVRHSAPDRLCKQSDACVELLLVAPIAQSAERFHGKEKVKGSIPFWGSRGLHAVRAWRGSSGG